MPRPFDATYLKDIFMRTDVECYESWVERYASSKRPSVIVPVYRNQPELFTTLSDKAFLAAIEKLIIVFDGGPKSDESDLARAAKLLPPGKLVFIRNRRNLGFPRSVNIGIGATGDESVIILNSDAYISSVTVKRLRQAAALSDSFATLSPLSYSNGHYSLKVLSGEDIGISDLASHLRAVHDRLSLMDCPLLEQVPVNNGFCLYITRAALNKVGQLDHLLFARGYGEETDFCLRASKYGLSNQVVLTAFGHHQGGKSFGVEREGLKKRNSRIVQSIHPTFHADLKNYENNSLFVADLPKAFVATPDLRVTGLRLDSSTSAHTIIENGIVKINPLKMTFSKLFDYIVFCAVKLGLDNLALSDRRQLTSTQCRLLKHLSLVG